MHDKDYIVTVQCELVKQRCSGYACEKAFHDRAGGFALYPRDKQYRTLTLTCGGCSGRALQGKLAHLKKKLANKEQMSADRIVVHLSTCITRESHHGPVCPHLDYLKDIIAKTGLDCREDTYISAKAQQRREAGIYRLR